MFPLGQWAKDQASPVPTKLVKGQPKTCPGQAKFEIYLSQGQAGIHVFQTPVNSLLCSKCTCIYIPYCAKGMQANFVKIWLLFMRNIVAISSEQSLFMNEWS